MASPSLATYRPPEDFKDEAEQNWEYFGRAGSGVDRKGKGKAAVTEEVKQEDDVAEDKEREAMRKEHAKYFREAGPDEERGDNVDVDVDQHIPRGPPRIRRRAIPPIYQRRLPPRPPVALQQDPDGVPPLVYISSSSSSSSDSEDEAPNLDPQEIDDPPVVWARPPLGPNPNPDPNLLMPPIVPARAVANGPQARFRAGALEMDVPAQGPEMDQLRERFPGVDVRVGMRVGPGARRQEVEAEAGLGMDGLDDEFAGEDDMEGAFEGELSPFFSRISTLR